MSYQFNKTSLFLTKLKASTLLETIVASVIFLIIFAMAIDTMTRMMVFDHQDSEYLLIESAFNKYEREMRNKEIVVGSENYTFEWGGMNVITTYYEDGLYLIEMNALSNSKKKVKYQYILADETVFE